jgi:hypothetical protein
MANDCAMTQQVALVRRVVRGAHVDVQLVANCATCLRHPPPAVPMSRQLSLLLAMQAAMLMTVMPRTMMRVLPHAAQRLCLLFHLTVFAAQMLLQCSESVAQLSKAAAAHEQALLASMFVEYVMISRARQRRSNNTRGTRRDCACASNDVIIQMNDANFQSFQRRNQAVRFRSRRIFFNNISMPYVNASAVGGHPGTDRRRQ